jgi:hypothetical protein
MIGREIRFIDSKYNELFRIPDGGIISVKYPDGHIENRNCKYIDDYHTEINGVCYHICQWAEIMEENDKTYFPAEPPEYTLENITPEEFEFMYANRSEIASRGCIGHLRADFDKGNSFFNTWWTEDDKLKTPEFSNEFNKIIDYFRKGSYTPFLKSRNDMYNAIFLLKPVRMAEDNEVYGFKLTTEKHTYFFRCNPRVGEYNLYAYCYNTKALEKFKNLRTVEKHSDDIKKDKFFKTDYGFEEVYYNPDSTAGGQIVYNEIGYDLIQEASKEASLEQFYDFLSSGCKQSLIDIDTPEFKSMFFYYTNKKADFEGINAETMKGLIKHARAEKKKSEPER